MAKPLGIKVKFKVDDADVKKYLKTLKKDGINIEIKNFSQIDKQFKEIISNINKLKSFKGLKTVDAVNLKRLKEVESTLKKINELNKNIKIKVTNEKAVSSRSKESSISSSENQKNDIYSKAEKSIRNQIEIQKQLVKAKEVEAETLRKNLKLEEESYENLKKQLDLTEKIKLNQSKDDLQRTKIEPLMSRELDKQLENERKAVEKTQEVIAKSKRKAKEEELKDAERQANQINKAMEQNWGKIESFKRSQGDSLNNMGYKYKGLYKTDEIESFREELSKLSPTSKTLEKDIDQLNNKIKNFKNELVTRNNMHKLGADISNKNNGVDINSNEDEIKKLIKNIGGVSAEIKKIDSTPILQNGNEIRKVNYRVEEGKDKWHEYQLSIVQAVNGGNTSLRQLDRGMRDVTNKQVTFSQRLKHAWSSVLSFATVSALFFGIKKSFENGIKTVIDLDSAMTDLKKVTNESDEAYKDFIGTANKMAIAVGHSTKAAIESTTEFAKLGFTMRESAKLAQEALIYSNIGDIDVGSATKSIVSTLKGFKMEAGETRHIIDSLNEVGNNFAITSGGIGNALQRSASSLNEANNTFEESIGLITAANASVQDPEKVGNSLKTIATHLRGISEESGEAIPKLRETIQSIAGVDIMQDKDTFKSTYEILVEISKVWDGISDKDRATLAEKIAGKNQANVFASIMGNMEDGIAATETALDSFGSAALEQEKYMDSIAAKINTFKETLAMFWNNIIESDSIKIIVDLGTSIIKVLDGLFNSSQKVNRGFILTIASALGLSKSFRGMIQNLIHYDSNAKKVAISTRAFKLEVGKVGDKFKVTAAKGITFSGVLSLIKSGFDKVKISAILAKVAISAAQAALTFGISFILTTAISALGSFIEKLLGSKDAANELVDTFRNNVQQNNSNIQSLSKIADEYEKLSSKTHLSAQEQERLVELNNSIADMLPETLVGYDEQGNAIVSLTGNLRDYIKELENKNKLEAKQFLAEGHSDKAFRDALRKSKEKKDEVAEINKKVDRNNNGVVITSKGISISEDINTLKKKQSQLPRGSRELEIVERDIKKIEDANRELHNQAAALDKNYSEFNDVILSWKQSIIMSSDDFGELDNNIQVFLKKYIDSLDLSNFKDEYDAEDYINNLIKAMSQDPQSKELISQIEKLNKEAKSGKVKGYEEEVKKLIDQLAKAKGLDSDILSRIFKIDVKDIKEVNKVFQKTLEDIEKAGETYKNSIDNMNFYDKVMKEIDENGKLSQSTISEIIEKHGELIPLLGNERELYNEIAKEKVKEEKTAKEAVINKLKSNEKFFKDILNNNVSLNNKLKALYGEDYENYKTFEDAKRRTNALLTNIYGDQWFTKFNSDTEAMKAFVKDYEKMQADIKNGKRSDLEKDPRYSKENYDKIVAQLEVDKLVKQELEDYGKTLDNVSLSQEENTKKVDKNKEVIDAIKRSLKDLEIQLKNVDYLLHKQENRMKNMVKGSQEYRDALKEENRLLEQKIGLFNQEIEVSENGAAKLGSIIATNGGASLGTQLVETAKEYLGRPYVWGGTDPSGFDCAGFVQYVYKQFGIELGRQTYDQIKNGIAVPKDQLQLGDLVFFTDPIKPEHVGMYIGDGKYIQSPETGDVVKISNLNDRSDYSGARRIINSSNVVDTNPIGTNVVGTSSLDSSLEGLLKGHGNDFIRAGQKYGVDPYLLAAISMLESARGTSQPIREHNNPSGIMDWDNEYKTIKHFNSLEEAIDFTAKNLKDLYLDKGLSTIEQIGAKYAPINAENDRNKTNKHWIPSVKSIYKELSGKEPSNLTVVNVSEKDLSNVESERQQLLDKSLTKKTSTIDVQQNIMDNDKEIYESYVEEMENEIKLIDTKIKKTQLEKDMRAQDSSEYIKFLKQEAIYNNDKIQKIKKEKEFVDEQIKNKDKIYSKKTIAEMQEKSRELEVSIKEIVKSVKDVNFSWIDSKLQSINKRVQENVDMINNAISRIENSDNSNLVEQMQLKAQIVELDKQNVQELQSFMEELNDEQRRSGAAYLSEKLKEVNVELDNANTQLQQNKKELKEIKNTIASLIENVEDKIKQVIQKNNELYKESLEKNLKLFEKAVDEQIKKLDEAEKRINHNETTYDDNKKIFELQEKLNRLELNDSIEGKQKKLELEKELNQAIRQQKSNQVKYEISSRKESLQKAKDDYNKYLQEYNDKISRLEANDNLNIEAKQALINGYILDLNGNKIEVEKALLDFEDKFGKGLSSIGDKIKTEIIDNLNEVRNILNDFGTLDTTKMEPSQKAINVYGKGIDLENAKKVLGARGYNYVDTDTVAKEKIHLNPNDIVLGGEKVNLDRKDLNGAFRFDGKDRYKTLELIQLYKDVKDGKIAKETGTVYGSGIDLTNAKKWLGMFGYNFVDTSTKKVSPSDITANDIVVGGKSAKNGLNFDVKNRLSGDNREATDKAIYEKFLDLANGKIDKYYKTGSNTGTVYGSGADLVNAKKYLFKLGYNFVETNDVRDKKLTPNDIVVGGEGAVQGKDNILNSQATWLNGKNRSETENLIKEYAYKYIAGDLPINLRGFSEGGVVSQTGLAMVHGGNGHDEVMLNNAQATNLFNFIKNLPHMTKNMIPNLNIPSLQNMIKPIKSDSNHQSNEEYNIAINVNGTLNATEDEANNFANLLATKLRKRR